MSAKKDEKPTKVGKTEYEKWTHGYTSPGSFAEALFLAYQLSDSGNEAILKAAFPHFFVTVYGQK